MSRRIVYAWDLFFERLPSVVTWPDKWRKAFVLLFPICVPLWCAYVVLLVILALAFIAIAGAILAVHGLWTGGKE